jgi:metal-responsive CopG/Arc/MetJ family transcriptional regulator
VATTVHIPKEILQKIDERAKVLNLSRNRFIVQALERVLADQTTWSPDFLEYLGTLKPLDCADDFIESIRANRRSKASPVL